MPSTTSSVPPFLRAYPPWYARTAGWLIAAVAAFAAIVALTVRFPVALEARFTIVEHSPCASDRASRCDPVLVGEIELPQDAFAELSPEQTVELSYDALPFARWGARRGTLRAIDSTIDHGLLRARFDAGRVTVPGAHGERSLGAGATGTARIVLGQRTLLDHALQPLRELQRRWHPSDEPARGAP